MCLRFAATYFLAPDLEYFYSWKNHLGALAIIFAVTYALFFFKVLGGGDAKLASAFALWVGLSGLTPFLFYMSVAGALLSIIILSLRRWKPVKEPTKDSWIDRAQKGSNEVPYGIAIFIGAILSFLENWIFRTGCSGRSCHSNIFYGDLKRVINR